MDDTPPTRPFEDDDFQPTQVFTQPHEHILRSNLWVPRAEEILCLLRPINHHALTVLKNIAKSTPQHILFERDEEDDDESSDADVGTDNGRNPPKRSLQNDPKAIALRVTSRVRNLARGFVFGRSPDRSDIVIETGLQDARISSRHFRIFLNECQILMIEDLSTNGTVVDGDTIKSQNPDSKRVLSDRTTVALLIYGRRTDRRIEKAEFTVSLPERDAEQYAHNLQNYVQRIKRAEDSHPSTRLGVMRQTPLPLISAGTTPSVQGMAAWNGSPHYKVLEKIGSGTFASVYRVCTYLGGTVLAAKEIDIKKTLKNGVVGQAVNHELNIIKTLSHVSCHRLSLALELTFVA